MRTGSTRSPIRSAVRWSSARRCTAGCPRPRDRSGRLSDVTSGPPAAWYADPGGSGGLRYWDGNAWTEHVTALPGRAGGYGSITPAPAAPGRKLWPWFVVIGALFGVA